MFDLLVDNKKKRRYLTMILLFTFLEIALILDTAFSIDVFKAGDFTGLLALNGKHSQSFLAYFFFSCLQSGIIYQSPSLAVLPHMIGLVLQAFSVWEWLLLCGLVFLIISHQSRVAKISLCLIGAYFLFHFALIIGISLYLSTLVSTNSAGTVLSGIQTSAVILIVVHVLGLCGNSFWLYRLICKHYLKAF